MKRLNDQGSMINDRGSMVIEAAIIMPFFLAFVIAMISFVQIAVAEMALQSSVSETTKQVSAHMYPIYLMNHTNEQFASRDALSVNFSTFISESLLSVFNGHGVNLAILSLLQLYVDENLINKKNLIVVEATLPKLNNKNKATFGFTAEYKLKLFIPFMSREVRIRKTSYERIWIGD